ncbi:MAG: hypothetical protein GF355_09295 [Candidatus Eisenbacteria bacterium]|nr:hypothetical protein [Candidatus Eisenbacteria bacterium]
MSPAHPETRARIAALTMGSLLLLALAASTAHSQDCIPGWETFPDFQTNTVYAVYEHNDVVYRGGWFSLFRWNGSQWEVFGGGIGGNLTELFVADFETYPGLPSDDNDLLIVAGYFPEAGDIVVHSIATWDGSTFGPVGGGVNGNIRALTVYNGDLIAGGDFSVAGGISARNIARWDGNAWHPLGSGVYDPVPDGSTDEVRDMAVWNGDLYVVGSFSHAGDEEVSYVARWDGSQWSDVGGGVSVIGGGFTGNRGVGPHGDELVITGAFDFAGGVPAINIAAWDGAEWSPLGSGSDPYDENFGFRQAALSVASYKDLLYVGADFSDAVGMDARALAVWDGESWSPVDEGLWGEGLFGPFVMDLQVAGEGVTASLLMGGDFNLANGEPTDNMARYTYCEETSGLAAVERPGGTLRVHLSRNPAASGTDYTIRLAQPARVRAALFDVNGRRMASLLQRSLPAGDHRFHLDLAGPGQAAGGVRYLRVEAAGNVAARKLILMP